MENHNTFLFGKDVFAKAFQEFDETTFFQRLESRVKPQSYFHKYKDFKTVIATLSYLFNLISAFTASYLIFWLTQWLTGISFVAYGFSALFLFFMEKLKRKSSSEFFQVWFFKKKIAAGWLALSLSIFAASVLSTYYGTEKATRDFAPSASLVINDSTLTALYSQLHATEAQIAKARGTRWKGTTTRTSQQTINELSRQKTVLLEDIEQREKGKDNQNVTITQSHKKQVGLTATTLAWLTVLFELLFECCIAYIWFYYHRSFVEYKLINDGNFPSPTPFQSAPDNDPLLSIVYDLQQQIKLLQQQKNQPPLKNFPHENHKNGSPNGIKNETIRPIGFMTESQRNPNQALQHVITDEKLFLDDTHTIAHKDSRTGEIKRYTMARVDNFISHYEKGIHEALKSSMEQQVLDNRQTWLVYWKGKKAELQMKQRHQFAG